MFALDKRRFISPILPIAVLIVGMDLVAVPIALLSESENSPVRLDTQVPDRFIRTAYFATLYACAMLAILYFALRIPKHIRAYQEKPLEAMSETRALELWVATFVGGAACAIVLWVQAGFRIPVVTA